MQWRQWPFVVLPHWNAHRRHWAKHPSIKEHIFERVDIFLQITVLRNYCVWNVRRIGNNLIRLLISSKTNGIAISLRWLRKLTYHFEKRDWKVKFSINDILNLYEWDINPILCETFKQTGSQFLQFVRSLFFISSAYNVLKLNR